MSKSDKPGGIAPNDFTSTLAEYVGAKVAEESAAGKRRAIKARFEKLGAHKQGFDLFWKLRNMEPADAELTLVAALRYCRWANLQVGDQASLFASDDMGAPTEKVAAELTEAQAEERGFDLGINGRDVDECGFHAGTPLYAMASQGWKRGQALLAFQMGEDLPEGSKVLRKKAKAKKGSPEGTAGAEVREAAPSGGERRGRGRPRSVDAALAAGREHLSGGG